MRRSDLPRLFVVALVGAVLAPASLAWGLQHTSGTSASLLLNLEAFFTIVLARILYRESIGAHVAGALALMVAGGAMLVVDGMSAGTALGWGTVAVLGATLGWSVDNTLTRPLADRDPTRVVLWKAGLGSVMSLAVALALGEPFPPLASAAGLAACGALGYGLSLRLYLLAQRRIGAGRTASIFAVAPFVGAIFAWVLGERTGGLMTALAALLCALGVYLHLSEKHAHHHKHEPLRHEHAHSHDDGHHDHSHDGGAPAGEHSHEHEHDARKHEHPHAPDLHHRHH